MATLGRPSMNGSKVARSRPTSTIRSRSRSDLSPKRSTSASSRPRVLTTNAASNDSWAISATSALSRCASAAAARIRRW